MVRSGMVRSGTRSGEEKRDIQGEAGKKRDGKKQETEGRNGTSMIPAIPYTPGRRFPTDKSLP